MRYTEFEKVNGYNKNTPFTLSVERGSLQNDGCCIGTGERICVEDLIMHVVNGEGTISNPKEIEKWSGWGREDDEETAILMINYSKSTNEPHNRNEKSRYKVNVGEDVWDAMVRSLYENRLRGLRRFVDEKLVVEKTPDIAKVINKDGVFKKVYEFKMGAVKSTPYDFHLEFEIDRDRMKVRSSCVGAYKLEYTIECDIVHMNEYEMGEVSNLDDKIPCI